MERGITILAPSEFGKFLKAKRKTANLTQDDLAEAIGKTSQYISNIEKGKNNAPPNSMDIDALIRKLMLSSDEAIEFRRLAAADRNQLSNIQMEYLLKNKALLALIDYGIQNEINDSYWQKIFESLQQKRNFLNGGDL